MQSAAEKKKGFKTFLSLLLCYFGYVYDEAKMILKVDGSGKIDIYAYDGAGNRIAVNETYKSLQPSGFIDDATGNDVQYILKKTDYTYSNAGKLLKLVERMYDGSDKEVLRKTVNYYYDGNGNELSNTASWTHPHTIKLRQSTKGAVYGDNMENETDSLIDRVNNTFDGFGRLVKVERISAGVRSESTFIYNGDNLRVSKTVKKSTNGYKAVVTNYLYDRQNVILETDENNAVKTRYVKGINYIASISASNTTSYFLFNGHGDVVQTVDKDGEVLNNYDYDIWGNPILTVETAECAIRYAGEFYDSETGLYYLRARYYNPYIGRFISEDSYWGEDNNPLSLNRYTYAHNDPIQYIDPTGHAAVTKAALSAVVVGAIKGITSKIVSTTKAVTATKTETTTKTGTATKQVINDSLLKAVGIIGTQLITVSKAKTSEIKENTVLSAKSVEKTLATTTAVKKTSIGEMTQSEMKSKAAAINRITVKIENSIDTEVKVTKGREKVTDNTVIKSLLIASKSLSSAVRTDTIETMSLSSKKNTNTISEKQLRDQLEDLRNSQLKRTTKLKSLISSNTAVDTVLKYDKTIDEVSTELGVPKEMIQSVLYRELICYGLDDVAKDAVVRQYYISKQVPIPGTAYDLYNLFGVDDKVKDSSTGIGQIFASTAIKAENIVLNNTALDTKAEDDLWNMWQKLQDPETNIYYIGLVLKMEAKNLDIDLSSSTRKEKIQVMGEYNGNIDYGRHAIKYYDLFKKYNNN